VKSLAWSPDGQHIVSGGDDMQVHVWTPATGERIILDQDHRKWIRAVAWSPDGNMIAATSDSTVLVVTNVME
jgi:WD40 repeat protein